MFLKPFQMNSLFFFICLLLLGCSINSVFSKDAITETVSKHGYLSVSGVNLMNQHGERVQLKGMSLAWSIWWPQYFSADTVENVHTLCHGNIIRAPMAVDTKDGGYIKDPEGQMKLVETVIEAAIKNDIYVIVNWQEVATPRYLAEAKVFFGQISKKYGSYPNIIYETFNEPVDASWTGLLKPYHQELIKTIRANDPNNLIILGTPNYSQKVDDAAADPITGEKNIMYSLHFYSGTHKQWLRDTTEAALSKGLPIFVSEYGVVNADASGPVDMVETQLWWDLMDRHGLSNVEWAIYDKDEGASALKPGTTAKQACQEQYLTESGRVAVEQIKK